MKRVVSLIGGLALMISSVGCCCSQGCQPGCQPMYYGGGGGCPTGNCPTGGMVYPQTGSYTTYNAFSAAPVTASPYGSYPAYPVTAAAPIESLPTY